MLIPLLIWLLPIASPDTIQDPVNGRPHMTILFYGDSLTTGFGIDPDKAYPQVIQEKIDQLGWPFRVINGGVGGETTAGGLSRIDWVLQNRMDVFVLELGGNDGLRGVDPRVTRRNLRAIIRRVKDRYPDTKIILAGMQAPPNMGTAFTSAFKAIYPELAESENTPLIPFLLQGVGGIPELNLPDGIHPTAEGHAILAENVWKILKPVLEDLSP